MPLPVVIVPLAIGAAALLSVGAVTFALVKKLDGKHVAVLGGHNVGKSSLARYLLTKHVDIDASSKSGSILGTTFELQVGKRKIQFSSPKVVPSSQGLGFPQWANAFRKADFVWYLFRADLIASGDSDEMSRVGSHISLMQGWRGANTGKAPKVMLIGTWADQLPAWPRDPDRVLDTLCLADPIKFGAVKLGMAPVVVGSLVDDASAKQLVKQIEKAL